MDNLTQSQENNREYNNKQYTDKEYEDALNSKENQEAYLKYKQQQQNEPKSTFQTIDNENLLYSNDTKPIQTEEEKPQTQIKINDDEASVLQATQPQKYRNSGIAYFDNKKDLSIADAFLANYLKADIRLIDMNVNANVKKTNMNQALNKMYSTNNSIMQYTEGIDDYVVKDLGSVGDIISRKWNRFTGGALSWTSNDNKREQGLNESRARAYANIMSENPRGVTQKDMEISRGNVSTNYKDKTGVIADTNNLLTIARNKQQEEFNKIEELGKEIPMAEQLKLQAIDNMIKATSNGQYDSTKFTSNRNAILLLQQNKDDPRAIEKALQLIYKEK